MSELPKKLLIVRHLERIDDEDNVTAEEIKQWFKIKRENRAYITNPYLQQTISIEKLVKNIGDIKINHIISSPFLRCIESALIISKEIKFTDKIIINNKLGELFNEDFLFRIPCNYNDIYEHSVSHIAIKEPEQVKQLNTLDNVPLLFEKYESDEEYYKRIRDVLEDIQKTYDGNILVVTHADAYKQFNPERKRMNYGIVYEINLNTSPEVSKSYEKKYIKYKLKYLQLKNKYF